MPITSATTTTGSSSGTADAILLELVDEDGVTIGTAEKLAAHQPPGQLHRAFSVFLFDEHGRLLLQRRALGKYHSPGVWSNTCCGHPYPGEAPFAAAARRTFEELGVLRRCWPRRVRSATTTPTPPRAWWSRSTTTSSSAWCSPRCDRIRRRWATRPS
ncbi:Isopentenyl-diphosphate Delta-isomerase [Streptomyces violarus]